MPSFTDNHRKYLISNIQACNPFISPALLSIASNLSQINIVQHMEESSPDINEVFGICFLRRSKIDCDKILVRVLNDNGMCFTYNMQGFRTLFNDNISRDFHSYKRKKIAKSFDKNSPLFHQSIDDDFDTDEDDWNIFDSYKTSSDDVFPLRATKDTSVTFTPGILRINLNNLCNRSGKGFRIIFHSSNEIATSFHNEFFVPFDFERVIVLTAKFTRYDNNLSIYSPLTRSCYFKNERKLKFFKSYSKAHCLLECQTDYVLKVCGCVKFSMPRDETTKVCSLSEVFCYNQAILEWPYADRQGADTVMPCDCFPTCNDITYSFKMDKLGIMEAKVRTFENEWEFFG
jgi:amiloride-sensitive sodium channel